MSKKISVKKLREFPCQIRGIDKSSGEYQRLVESVARYGVLEPLTVVKVNDPTTGEVIYSIVHGLQRFNAANDAGVTSVPVWIAEMTDEQIEQAQLVSAIHKINAKPVQISKAMKRMLGRHPNLKSNEMASVLCTTPTYINERFGLTRLEIKAAALVNESKICLSNAYALAKLPPSEQFDFIDRALCMHPCEFSATVIARVQELRSARKTDQIKFDPISIKVLKPNDFKTGPHEIELGILYHYIGTGVVKIEDGHHRFAANIDMAARIKIKVVK